MVYLRKIRLFDNKLTPIKKGKDRYIYKVEGFIPLFRLKEYSNKYNTFIMEEVRE